jgi:mono/diheme cytochrome c family protein
MKMILGFAGGIAITVALAGAVSYLAVVNGWLPARQDEAPGELETWAAHHALKATLNREATMQSPIAADEENLMAGAEVYHANCAGCHGTPKDPEPAFAKGFIPPPTLFGNGDIVSDDPEGWSYWKIKHGIKFTGMPSFTPSLSDKEMWQVTLFLKHMDKLPDKVKAFWREMK